MDTFFISILSICAVIAGYFLSYLTSYKSRRQDKEQFELNIVQQKEQFKLNINHSS